LTSVCLIIPTFREAENIRALLQRLGEVRASSLPDLEVIIVDDDSDDGLATVVDELALPWLRLMVRRGERGLSTAVLAGMRAASSKIVAVMDADLSHPPEKLPDLIACIENGADMAIGSRYAPGGSTEARWSIWRWINSRVATVLALPFTSVHDPMSGFFALPHESLDRAGPLCPLGYKIGLELIVKCRCRRIDEIPIDFRERERGRSKLTVRQQALYLRHVLRLLRWRIAHRNGVAAEVERSPSNR
jgi:dolichol-phosphate mannosyltransferase